MNNIDHLLRRFCEAGALAVRRYVDVSGELWSMPEYFTSAFLLDQLGNDVTVTLETSFRDLIDWNHDARERRGLPPAEHDRRLLDLAQYLEGRRIDMALFAGEDERTPKALQDFIALVEFKKGCIDAGRVPGKVSDRDRLLMLLEHVDTCRWGIVCGWATRDHCAWQKGDMKGTADRWYESTIELPKEFNADLLFGARLFGRGSDERRISNLLSAI